MGPLDQSEVQAAVVAAEGDVQAAWNRIALLEAPPSRKPYHVLVTFWVGAPGAPVEIDRK